jgi:sulfur carrier protein
MIVTVNGEKKDVDEGLNLMRLIETFGLNPKATAVQHNEDIVRREDLNARVLQDGDIIELIRIVGGG